MAQLPPGWLLLLALALAAPLGPATAHAQDASLHWEELRGQVPGAGAVIGSQADATQRASAVYLCRAKQGSAIYPGRWSNGTCYIAAGGQQVAVSDCEIAYGQAEWHAYQPGSAGLIPAGTAPDGSPAYSCRVQYRGWQLGVITDNKCSFAFDDRTILQRPPFDALYLPGEIPSTPPAPPSAPPPQKQSAGRDNLGSLAPMASGSNPGAPSDSCRKEVGKARANQMVKQCLQVSPATHPPCNAENNCALIRQEIVRSCKLLGNRAPDFCDQYR